MTWGGKRLLDLAILLNLKIADVSPGKRRRNDCCLFCDRLSALNRDQADNEDSSGVAENLEVALPEGEDHEDGLDDDVGGSNMQMESGKKKLRKTDKSKRPRCGRYDIRKLTQRHGCIVTLHPCRIWISPFALPLSCSRVLPAATPFAASQRENDTSRQTTSHIRVLPSSNSVNIAFHLQPSAKRPVTF